MLERYLRQEKKKKKKKKKRKGVYITKPEITKLQIATRPQMPPGTFFSFLLLLSISP